MRAQQSGREHAHTHHARYDTLSLFAALAPCVHVVLVHAMPTTAARLLLSAGSACTSQACREHLLLQLKVQSVVEQYEVNRGMGGCRRMGPD